MSRVYYTPKNCNSKCWNFAPVAVECIKGWAATQPSSCPKGMDRTSSRANPKCKQRCTWGSNASRHFMNSSYPGNNYINSLSYSMITSPPVHLCSIFNQAPHVTIPVLHGTLQAMTQQQPLLMAGVIPPTLCIEDCEDGADIRSQVQAGCSEALRLQCTLVQLPQRACTRHRKPFQDHRIIGQCSTFLAALLLLRGVACGSRCLFPAYVLPGQLSPHH